MSILAFVGAVAVLFAGLIFVPRIAGIACLWVALYQAGFLKTFADATCGTLEGFLLIILYWIIILASVIAFLCDMAHLNN